MLRVERAELPDLQPKSAPESYRVLLQRLPRPMHAPEVEEPPKAGALEEATTDCWGKDLRMGPGKVMTMGGGWLDEGC